MTPCSLVISLHLRERADNVLGGSLKRGEAFVRDVLVPSLPGLADLQEPAEPGVCCLLPVTSPSLVKKQLALVAGAVCPMAEQGSGLGRSTVGTEIFVPCLNTGHSPNPACGSYGPFARDLNPGVPRSTVALHVSTLELTFTALLLHSVEHRSHGEPLPHPPALPSLSQQPLPGPARLGPSHPRCAAAVGAEPSKS